MWVNLDPFGYNLYGETIGSAWMNLVGVVLQNGQITSDEGRKRLSLQNIRIKSLTQVFPDPLIEKYGNKKNVDEMISLTFDQEVIHDFDIVPSFSPGSQSYFARIKNWKMLDFVVARLTEIPESKKAIMSFVREEDYVRTLDRSKDDYLPCITTIQFRLLKIENKGYHLNTIFNARSIDAYQKSGGNLAAIALLSREVCRRLEKNLKVRIWTGPLDGFITDAHIYKETLAEAKKVYGMYKHYDQNIE